MNVTVTKQHKQSDVHEFSPEQKTILTQSNLQRLTTYVHHRHTIMPMIFFVTNKKLEHYEENVKKNKCFTQKLHSFHKPTDIS